VDQQQLQCRVPGISPSLLPGRVLMLPQELRSLHDFKTDQQRTSGKVFSLFSR